MQLTIREPGSAITHFIGCLMALIAASPLLIKAHGNATYMLAMTIFATSMVLLYAASTIYHSICHVSTKVLRNFQKLDHMMIFVLIAGSYTPVCMIILGGRIGYTLLALVWGLQWQESLSKDSGSPVRNGFLPSFTLPWAGRACRYLPGCGRISRMPHLAGF